MGRGANVNVDVNVPSTEGGNVNVQERHRLKKAYESRIVKDIMRELGPSAKKDEGWWHKVAQNLSENEVRIGLEIAANKKPFGLERVRYVSGIYANMLKKRLNR